MIEIVVGAAAILVVLFGFVVAFGAPYVPSKRGDVRLAFDELYRVGSRDVLVDIGSGDGVILREAAKRGARAVGYEINPVLVLISRWLSRADSRVSIKLANFWRTPLPDTTTVVYTFGESRDISRMAARIQSESTRIGRTLWFVSYGFEVPGQTHTRKHGAHFLYQFSPLQKG